MISEKKIRINVSITKELNDRLDDIVEGTKGAFPMTKSQVMEIATWYFIRHSMEQTRKENK